MPHFGYFAPIGYPKPLIIPAASFVPELDTQDWLIHVECVRNNAVLTQQRFNSGVLLPHGVTVKRLTLIGWRNDAAASMVLVLARRSHDGDQIIMTSVTADWTIGDSEGYSETISGAVIDNNNYYYSLYLTLDPNDSVLDVRFRKARIDWQ